MNKKKLEKSQMSIQVDQRLSLVLHASREGDGSIYKGYHYHLVGDREELCATPALHQQW
jgi:hypothetical protein